MAMILGNKKYRYHASGHHNRGRPTLEQYYAGLPVRRLKEMHESAHRAYEHDKNLTQQEKDEALFFGSPLAYYGTDQEKDWPEHVDAIEKALSDKNEVFKPIAK